VGFAIQHAQIEQHHRRDKNAKDGPEYPLSQNRILVNLENFRLKSNFPLIEESRRSPAAGFFNQREILLTGQSAISSSLKMMRPATNQFKKFSSRKQASQKCFLSFLPFYPFIFFTRRIHPSF
jgi:hypothetical protein